MVYDWNERPIASIPFLANNTQFVDVPRDRPIRRIIMRFIINLTTLAVAPTYTEDDVLNLVKKIRIVMNGNDNKINNKARLHFYVEKYEKQTLPNKVAPPTAVSTTANSTFTVIADFANKRQDEGDVSALLMARRLSSLRLEIDWADNTVIASANAPTINVASTSVEVQIREVSGEQEVIMPDGIKKTVSAFDLNPADIREGSDTLQIDKAYSQFDNASLKYNVIPAPATILTTLWMILANVTSAANPAGTKDNTLLTDYKVQRESPKTIIIIQRTFLNARDEQKVEYQLETLDVGILYNDWVDVLEGGLVNNGREGDIKFRFLTIAPIGAISNIDFFSRWVPTPATLP